MNSGQREYYQYSKVLAEVHKGSSKDSETVSQMFPIIVFAMTFFMYFFVRDVFNPFIIDLLKGL